MDSQPVASPVSQDGGQPAPGGPSGRGARALAIGLLVLGLYWLYGWRPFLVHSGLVVDDFLFVRQAHGIVAWLRGGAGWLGTYDAFLLAKAPLYGVWLALLHVMGIPLRVGDFLLLLAGPLLFARALRPVATVAGWRLAGVMILLVANPLLPSDFRPQRNGLQVCLANLCLIAIVGMLLRARRPLRELGVWAALAGLGFGLCYLNREESLWLVPAIVLVLALLVLVAATDRATAVHGWRRLLRPVVGTTVLFSAFLAPVLVVCTLNYRSYGVFLTSLRRSPALTALSEQLTSLEPEARPRYVSMTRATRLKVYDLSPSFARLRPALEEAGSFWAAGNPAHAHAHGQDPRDSAIVSSMIEFSLLHAAEQAGARSAPEALALFRAIEREVAAAVAAGRITAGPRGHAIVPAAGPGDRGRIVGAWGRALASLLTVARTPYYWPDAVAATQGELDDLSRLTSSAVVLFPKPAWQHGARVPVLQLVEGAQAIAYPLLLVVWLGLLVASRRDVLRPAPPAQGLLLWSVAIPLVGLVVFCYGMAMLEVLSFHFLASGSYNNMGFSPLSVACALSFVALANRWPAILGRVRELRARRATVRT